MNLYIQNALKCTQICIPEQGTWIPQNANRKLTHVEARILASYIFD